MRKLWWAAVVLAVLAGCGTGSEAGGSGWPAGRSFRSTSVEGHTLVAGTQVELRFAKDGTVNIEAGCNHLSGTGRLDSGRLVVSDLGGTDMGCDKDRMDQDSWLADFLSDGPGWRLDGGLLVLTAGPVRISLEEVVVHNLPLAGTRWVVDTVITGETASSAPTGAYLRFDGSKVTGATGCGPISGTAEPAGTSIAFSDITAGGSTCTADSAALDTAVRAALSGTVEYSIKGSRLTLTGPGGHGLGLLAAS